MASTPVFTDVAYSHPNYQAIIELAERKVINGYSDGTFRPAQQLNRAEFAAFVARSLELPAADSNFKDVPKSAALYDGVSRAYKAGIIKGFSDGTFKPSQAVNRQDMAVMIDRAMQLKGSYTQRKALNFSDSSKVGAYAKTSVERLYHYNVMGALSGTLFQPTTIGTRADTAKHIYNMLQVLEAGTVTTPLPSTGDIGAIMKKNPLDLTHVEIVKAYGPYVITRRFDMFGQVKGIEQYDWWLNYTAYLAAAKKYNYPKVMRPLEWLDESKKIGSLQNLYADVRSQYPNYELIALNGIPFVSSELMTGLNKVIYLDFEQTERGQLSPNLPNVAGQFKVDIHYKKHDFVTYYSDSVKINKQLVLPYTKDNKALMVDVKSAFANTQGVSLSANSISYGGNTVTFTNGSTTVQVNGESKMLSVSPEMKNGVQVLPIREIASHLGLVTRVSIGYFNKIEIQNYAEADPFGVFR